MFDPQAWGARLAMSFVVVPVFAIVLFGTGRLVALGVRRWMPDGPL